MSDAIYLSVLNVGRVEYKPDDLLHSAVGYSVVNFVRIVPERILQQKSRWSYAVIISALLFAFCFL
jgi:hypothetical protein